MNSPQPLLELKLEMITLLEGVDNTYVIIAQCKNCNWTGIKEIDVGRLVKDSNRCPNCGNWELEKSS